MEILIKASQLILSLSILVILHELGHFIPAKLFKTRVEKFYLFFDAGFSLFKIKKGETEYGIGWLPLGGYVKIAGMIDESMDKEQMKQPPQPWEFRSKPAWQRLIIMLGGVTVNVILGMLIYMMTLFIWGEKYLPLENMKYGIVTDSTAQSIGFKNEDKILSVGDKSYTKFSDVLKAIIVEENNTVQLIRGTETINIELSDEDIAPLIASQSRFMGAAIEPIVGKITSGENAEKAGIENGDHILSVNGKEVKLFHQLVELLQAKKGEKVDINVLRKDKTLSIQTEVTQEGTIGFQVLGEEEQLGFAREEYDFLGAIPGGISKAYTSFGDYIKQLKLFFKPKTGAYKSLGGFMTIGKAFSPEWNWERFWNFTALLSIILAIMNILPIPALDGGHVMFLIYEMITGKPAPEKFMEYAQIVGIILLLSLMVLANGNDIYRSFFK